MTRNGEHSGRRGFFLQMNCTSGYYIWMAGMANIQDDRVLFVYGSYFFWVYELDAVFGQIFSLKSRSAAAGWPSGGRNKYFCRPHNLKEAKIAHYITVQLWCRVQKPKFWRLLLYSVWFAVWFFFRIRHWLLVLAYPLPPLGVQHGAVLYPQVWVALST